MKMTTAMKQHRNQQTPQIQAMKMLNHHQMKIMKCHTKNPLLIKKML